MRHSTLEVNHQLYIASSFSQISLSATFCIAVDFHAVVLAFSVLLPILLLYKKYILKLLIESITPDDTIRNFSMSSWTLTLACDNTKADSILLALYLYFVFITISMIFHTLRIMSLFIPATNCMTPLLLN